MTVHRGAEPSRGAGIWIPGALWLALLAGMVFEPAGADSPPAEAGDETGGEARGARELAELAAAAASRGDLDAAQRAYRRAAELLELSAPGSLELADALNQLGILAWRRGDLDAAEAYYRRAIAIGERRPRASLELARSLNALSIVFQDRSDLELAEDTGRRALAAVDAAAPADPYRANILNSLGNVYWLRGDSERAEEAYRRALSRFEEDEPESLRVAALLDNMGLVAKKGGRFEAARGYHHRALAIRRKLAPDSLPVATTLGNLGSLEIQTGELDLAERHLLAATAIAERLAPDSLRLSIQLNNLGDVARERGQPAKAEAHYRRALAIVERLASGSRLEAETLHMLAGALGEQGRRREAAATFDRAVSSLEAQMSRLGGSHGVQGGFRANYGPLYREALAAHLDLGDPARAFHVLEMSRARGLLAMLAERDLILGAMPADLDAELERLAKRYDRLQRTISGLDPESQGDEIQRLLAELGSLRRGREDLVVELRRAAPELAALQYPRPLDLTAASRALDGGTVMLSFSVGEDRTDLFIVTPDGELDVRRLAVGEAQLRERVADFRHWIERSRWPRHRPGATDAGRRLYRLLVAPAKAAMERAQRILIVPDGPLLLLPFAALIRPLPAEEGGGEQYLAAWKPQSIVQSATLYSELRRARRPSPAGGDSAASSLVAFGDPRYPTRARPADLHDVRLRSAARRGLFDWDALPYSRREVERIVELYPPGAARAFLGDEALEEHAKTIGASARVVHFATHGYLDDRFPLNSGLALTVPKELGEGRENGLLQAWEILESVRLDADLVVLSACQSGLGAEQPGEGLIGLTRAFQYAGARSIVASLWSVEDETTAELMLHLYRHLRSGASKDEALRAAQLALIQRPVRVERGDGESVVKDASAPYYWAAFQLVGDWR